MLHPTGVAAWFGILITLLNLLPFAQLDGGHVAYALFGSGTAMPPGRCSSCSSFSASLAGLVVVGGDRHHHGRGPPRASGMRTGPSTAGDGRSAGSLS